MRKLSILCMALLCLALRASAQDSAAAFDATGSAAEPAPAAPASLLPPDREPWQLGVGFQYMHFDVLGQTFHNYAYKADVTRYFSNWFGVEGTVIAGFGHLDSNSNTDAKSLFLGGGPHISILNTSHLEPWVHVLGGWQHFRFTQTATLGTASHAAFMAGAGLDYKIRNGRLYWRIQGDWIGDNIGPKLEKDNYSVGTGLVLNF